ncbi:hypothetical protein BDP55DRAFT_209860 [Colletotrichum godetiae]|uniref:Transmembrane protein n=1 Tax=Colletotrichum godetiae TaxID=1209918 RepID=A0AAJ0AX33_9PEZI|nr:uncharacterized protein BDP55DRAFT_209860 [Colletotrichum godetiae]KAK1699872.1 hypothetical protein BDP55DRAFT_209860 [Colletotrichum godetiae]
MEVDREAVEGEGRNLRYFRAIGTEGRLQVTPSLLALLSVLLFPGTFLFVGVCSRSLCLIHFPVFLPFSGCQSPQVIHPILTQRHLHFSPTHTLTPSHTSAAFASHTNVTPGLDPDMTARQMQHGVAGVGDNRGSSLTACRMHPQSLIRRDVVHFHVSNRTKQTVGSSRRPNRRCQRMPSAARQEQRSHSAHGAEKMDALLGPFHPRSGGEAETRVCWVRYGVRTPTSKCPDPSLPPVYGRLRSKVSMDGSPAPEDPVSADGCRLVDGLELLEGLGRNGRHGDLTGSIATPDRIEHER